MAHLITKSHIKRELIDIAGKKRVWIEMPDGEWQMLKFSEKPILTKIQTEIDRIIEWKEKEKKEKLEQ